MQQWFDPEAVQKTMSGWFGGAAAPGVQAWLSAVTRGNLELMGLASRRTQAMMELPSRLATCRTPQDLMGEQMRFWQTAASQYSEGYTRAMQAYQAAVPMASAFAVETRDAKANGKAADRRERDMLSFPDAREPVEGGVPSEPGKAQRRAAAA